MAQSDLENKGNCHFLILLWLHLQDPKGPFWISSLLPNCCCADDTPGMSLANHCLKHVLRCQEDGRVCCPPIPSWWHAEVVQGKGLKPEQHATGKNEFCKRVVKLASLVAPNGRVQTKVVALLMVH